MFCPNCGNQQTTDQKFCRVCGLNLELVSEVLSDESKLEKFDLVSFEERAENRKKRLGTIGVVLIISSLLVGCLIPILMGIGVADWTSMFFIMGGIAGLILFSGVIVTILSEMPPKISDPKEPTRNVLETENLKELSSADNFKPAKSVVENTTRKLERYKISKNK